MSRPLLITADPRRLDDLYRLTAAAAVEADVAADAVAARRSWVGASLVVVGDDVARDLIGARLPRRAAVVLVGRDLDDATVWQRAVELGAEHVVFLPDADAWVVERLVEAAAPAAKALVVGVVGGRGGAGATTLAAGLAVTARGLGHAAALVDADPLGGGIDVVLGAEGVRGARWPEVLVGAGQSAERLRASLPAPHGLSVVSWDRGEPLDLAPGVVPGVVAALGKDSDLVVVDIARGCADIAEVYTVVDVLLVVTTCEVRAVAATARVCAVAARHVGDLRLVVRGPSPGGLDAGVISSALGLPVAARLRSDRGLGGDLPPGLDRPARCRLGKAATRLVRELMRDARPTAVAAADAA